MFLFEAFQLGGWGMYPILLICLITIYLTIDRTTYLGKCKVDADRLISLIRSQIVSGNIRGAITTCQATPVPLTKIIAAGLNKAGGSEHDIQQAMDEEAFASCPRWKSEPATWPCWETWRPWPDFSEPSPASSSHSEPWLALTPR